MGLRTTLLIALLTFVCHLHAHQSSDFWILTNPEAPFVVQDDKGKMHGYAVDLVHGVLAEAGIEQDILAAPWERVEKEARTKANVLVFALAKTPERDPNYHWITPITANVFSLFAKKSSNVKISSMSQLYRLKPISVLRDDVRHNILLQQNIANISAAASWQDALDLVLNDDAKAIFFSDAGIEFFCKKQINRCADLERVFIYQKTYSYLVLSKPGTDESLVEKLQIAAEKYKASAEFNNMANFWLARYAKEVTIPMHLEDGTLNLWKK